MQEKEQLRCAMIGSHAWLIRCAEITLDRGHIIALIVTDDLDARHWAEAHQIPCCETKAAWAETLAREPFDYLFSIDNLQILSGTVLQLPRRMAINFHDAPLPRYAGVHATTWALLNGESQHGITWHEMTAGIDEGDILKQRLVPVGPTDTSLTLSSACLQACVAAFAELIDELATGAMQRVPQVMSERSYYPLWKRPPAAGCIDWSRSASQIDNLVRGLDFGPYDNPFCIPKLWLGQELLLVRVLDLLSDTAPSAAAPGTIIAATDETLTVTTASGDVRLRDLQSPTGERINPLEWLTRTGRVVGDQLPVLDKEQSAAITELNEKLARHEAFWAQRLSQLQPLTLDLRKPTAGDNLPSVYRREHIAISPDLLAAIAANVCAGNNRTEDNRAGNSCPGDLLLTVLLAFFARLGQQNCFDVAFCDAHHLAHVRQTNGASAPLFAPAVPLRVAVDITQQLGELHQALQVELRKIRKRGTYLHDLALRNPLLRSATTKSSDLRVAISRSTDHDAGIDEDTIAQLLDHDLIVFIPDNGSEIAWHYRAARFDATTMTRLLGHLQTLLSSCMATPQATIAQLALLTTAERNQLLIDWNATAALYPADQTIHQRFESYVLAQPTATALCFGDVQLTYEELTYEELTYEELNVQANQLAHLLRAQGVGTGAEETLVGLYLRRSIPAIVGLLGILKAGGVYVPLDPDYPPARLTHMLQDAAVRFVVTEHSLLDTFPVSTTVLGAKQHLDVVDAAAVETICWDRDAELLAAQPRENPPSFAAERTAYIIYTSGSTGRPKGVQIEHRSLVNYIDHLQKLCRLGPGQRSLQFASLNFDTSLEEIFSALATGATLVLRTDEMLSSVSHLLRRCAEWGITFLDLPTAYFHELTATLPHLEEPWPASVSTVYIGGEKLMAEQLQTWCRHAPPMVRLFNSYGPTETTIVSTISELHGGCDETERIPAVHNRGDNHNGGSQRIVGEISIGRPIQNVEAYILDQLMNPVPIGLPGELYIGGIGVARGYRNRPTLTAQVFVPNPFAYTVSSHTVSSHTVSSHTVSSGLVSSGTVSSDSATYQPDSQRRLYKTGDIVRYRDDGQIEYLGRTDAQVKIRGYRVELGEIETALLAQEHVGQVAVVAGENSLGEKQIVAYIVLQRAIKQERPDNKQTVALIDELRYKLSEVVPDYMIPAAFVVLEKLPLTVNGKVDQAVLPLPDYTRVGDAPYIAPRNAIEAQFVALWETLLTVDRVGIHDDFFALGGHSLLLMRLSSWVEQEFAQTVSIVDLLRRPTVAQMVACLSQQTSAETPVTNQADKSESGANVHTTMGARVADLLSGHMAVSGPPTWKQALLDRVCPIDARIWLFSLFCYRSILQQLVWHKERETVHHFLTLGAQQMGNGSNDARRDNTMPCSEVTGLLLVRQLCDRFCRGVLTRSLQRELARGNDRRLQVSGLEHLRQAHRAGNGVILAHVHSLMVLPALDVSLLYLAEHYLDDAPMVRYRGKVVLLQDKPLRQAIQAYFGGEEEIEDQEKNEEVPLAKFSSSQLDAARQTLLRDGVVNIAPDGGSGTVAITLPVWGEERAFRTGFAELALNTEAAVIPTHAAIGKAGEVRLTFLAPLDPGSPALSHEARIHLLMQQYVAFLESCWQQDPANVSLAWMRRLLKRG